MNKFQKRKLLKRLVTSLISAIFRLTENTMPRSARQCNKEPCTGGLPLQLFYFTFVGLLFTVIAYGHE